MKQAIVEAVARSVAAFDHIMVGVSGGLDSSIVAATLVALGKGVSCVTVATNEPDGDEREFARALTDHLGVDLLERYYSLDDIDIHAPISGDFARPSARTHEQSYYRQITEAMHETGARAFFTGNGGDAVFCLTQSSVALADRLLACGPGKGALETLGDICKLTGAAPFPVVRAALRKLPRSQRRYRWRTDRLFLRDSALDWLDGVELDHPWLDAPASALPGRAVHVAMLLRNQQALEGHHDFAVVHPLMSRTVIETALSIPTWRWVEGGIDRSTARSAFASHLPNSLIERRSKGGPDSFAVALIERFRGPIMDRLGTGHLVANGIISRPAVERAVRRFGPGQQLHHVRLLQLLEAENWAVRWEASAANYSARKLRRG